MRRTRGLSSATRTVGALIGGPSFVWTGKEAHSNMQVNFARAASVLLYLERGVARNPGGRRASHDDPNQEDPCRRRCGARSGRRGGLQDRPRIPPEGGGPAPENRQARPRLGGLG